MSSNSNIVIANNQTAASNPSNGSNALPNSQPTENPTITANPNADPATLAPAQWRPFANEGGFHIIDRQQWHADYYDLMVNRHACCFEGTYTEPIVVDIGAWTGEYIWWLETAGRARCYMPKVFCIQPIEEITKLMAHNLSMVRSNQGYPKNHNITVGLGCIFNPEWNIPHELVPNQTEQIYVWLPLVGAGFSATPIKPKTNLENYRKLPAKILSPKSIIPCNILKLISGGTEHLILSDFLNTISATSSSPDVISVFHWDLNQCTQLIKLMNEKSYTLTRHEVGPILNTGYLTFIQNDKILPMMHKVPKKDIVLQFP